jgi:tetratricopeptide (TPR) repeat protein
VAVLRHRLDRWLQGLYEGPDQWNPLRPDRLGEALIARALRAEQDRGQALLAAALNLNSEAQLERVLDVLARLVVEQAIEDILAAVFAQRHTVLVERCAEQTRGTAQRSGRTGLLDGLTRLHTKLLTDQWVADLPLPVQSALSSSADILGDLARAHGFSTRALAIFQGVFAIDKRRHELEPGNTTYRRDLSISYERLADLPQEAGHFEIARDLVDRAVSVRRAIHRLEPHRVDVAVEFAYTLYLSVLIVFLGEQENAGLAEREEIVEVIAPFERAGLLTARGHSLLAWAREGDRD